MSAMCFEIINCTTTHAMGIAVTGRPVNGLSMTQHIQVTRRQVVA